MLKPWSNFIRQITSMTKPRRPTRAARPGRLAAAAPAPARRAEYHADQPTVGTGVSVLGAAAESAGRGADVGFEAAFFAGASLALLDHVLARDSPFAGALRQRLALRAADRLRRPDAPSRGFLRAARRRASFARRRREPAHQPRRAYPSAVARFRRALRLGLTNQACARPPICSNCRDTSISKCWPGGCGVSFKAKKSFGGGGARRFHDDANAGRRATCGNRFPRCG